MRTCKHFVARLKVREPEQFVHLEFAPAMRNRSELGLDDADMPVRQVQEPEAAVRAGQLQLPAPLSSRCLLAPFGSQKGSLRTRRLRRLSALWRRRDTRCSGRVNLLLRSDIE